MLPTLYKRLTLTCREIIANEGPWKQEAKENLKQRTIVLRNSGSNELIIVVCDLSDLERHSAPIGGLFPHLLPRERVRAKARWIPWKIVVIVIAGLLKTQLSFSQSRPCRSRISANGTKTPRGATERSLFFAEWKTNDVLNFVGRRRRTVELARGKKATQEVIKPDKGLRVARCPPEGDS